MNKFLHMLSTLAVAIWLGGMFFLGPFVAKNTFQIMPSIVSEHPRAAAGKIMAKNFTDFDRVQFACAGVLLVTLGISAMVADRKFGPITRLLFALVATSLLVYSAEFITPKLLSMQDAVAQVEDGSALQQKFDEIHKSSVRIASINLPLLAIITMSLGWAGPVRPFDPEEQAFVTSTPASMP